jgi:hypothetical protein
MGRQAIRLASGKKTRDGPAQDKESAAFLQPLLGLLASAKIIGDQPPKEY